MATITIKPELREFLEKEGVLEKFIENVINYCIQYGYNERRVNSIMSAFFWDDTKQGYYYWENIDSKWRLYLKQTE